MSLLPSGAATDWSMTELQDQTAVVIGASGGIGAAITGALEASGRYAMVHAFSRAGTGFESGTLVDQLGQHHLASSHRKRHPRLVGERFFAAQHLFGKNTITTPHP